MRKGGGLVSKRRRELPPLLYCSLVFAILTYLSAQYLGSILLNPQKTGGALQPAPFENSGGDGRKMLEFEDLELAESEEETCDSWTSCGDGEEKANTMLKTYLLAKRHKLTQDKISKTVFKVMS